MRMTAAKIIVCEKSPRFAVALRSSGGQTLPLIEIRGLTQCEHALAEAPASLAAIEITAANLTSALPFISRIARHFPRARWVAMIRPELAQAASLLREAGALDVLSSTLEAPRLARLARRHLALIPAADESLAEWIGGQMPWSTLAAAGG